MTWLPVALAVSMNMITVLGVVAFGWPAGNVFILFWVENLVIGACSLVKIITARGTGGASLKLTINGRRTNPGPVGLAAFFCLHYGIFCLVHAVFTSFVAYSLGVDTGFLSLGLPIILILIRYAVETSSVWFGAGQRNVVSPAQAMTQPYPRIVVLQVAVLIAFGVLLSQRQPANPDSAGLDVFAPAVAWLDSALGQGAWLVLVLIIVKTAADVWTTRQATRV